MKRFTFASVALFCAVFLAVGQVYAITIDQFTSPQSASANQLNQTIFTTNASNTVLGGQRKLQVSWFSGPPSNSIITSANISNDGVFSHSQDASVIGQTLLGWDGSTTPSIHTTNLTASGIDFTQDGGNALVLELIGADIPSVLEITAYDARDPSSGSSSHALVTVPTAGQTLMVPFSQFTQNGLVGAVDFAHVGAITLLVNQTTIPSLDILFAWIGTNGQCRLVPNSAGRVIDECGVCGGNNSSCADCHGVPNGGAVYDSCGVCGGDNSTCRDCSGVIHGTAQYDRCGVCQGDGMSCLACTDHDITFILATMDAGAKNQERIIKAIYTQIEKSTKSRSTLAQVRALRRQAHALQIRNWILSWTTPHISTTCANTQFCVTVSNQSVVDEYRQHNRELRQMTIDAMKLWIKVNKNARRHSATYLRTAEKYFQTNENEVAQVPVTRSECT